jgi:hypothetical protein
VTEVVLFLPCAAGVEPLLADEVARITALEARDIEPLRGGVRVHGELRTAMQLNLYSRLAQRVLLELTWGDYRDEHDLYDLARRVPWEAWITPQQTLRVDSTAQRSPLRSLNFANLRIKDAVCDVMREHAGERPSVDTRFPDLPLALHLVGQQRLHAGGAGQEKNSGGHANLDQRPGTPAAGPGAQKPWKLAGRHPWAGCRAGGNQNACGRACTAHTRVTAPCAGWPARS